MKPLLVALLLVGSCWAQEAPKKPVKTDVSAGAPRYQIVINPNVRADTFLLDTVTGRIWIRRSYVDLMTEPEVWEPEDRVDNDQELQAFFGRHLTKKDAKAAGLIP